MRPMRNASGDGEERLGGGDEVGAGAATRRARCPGSARWRRAAPAGRRASAARPPRPVRAARSARRSLGNAGSRVASFGSSVLRACWSAAMLLAERLAAAAVLQVPRAGGKHADGRPLRRDRAAPGRRSGCPARRSRGRAPAGQNRRAPPRRRAPRRARRGRWHPAAGDEGRTAAIDEVVGDDARDDLAAQPVRRDVGGDTSSSMRSGK